MTIHKEPIDFIDIPALQHSSGAFYRVVYGEVDWNQDGNYRRVAHILTSFTLIGVLKNWGFTSIPSAL